MIAMDVVYIAILMQFGLIVYFIRILERFRVSKQTEKERAEAIGVYLRGQPWIVIYSSMAELLDKYDIKYENHVLRKIPETTVDNT